MYNLEDLNKQVIPQIQYLQSVGTTTENESGGKVSTYFFPSMVFPTYIELVSTTILCDNSKASTDKVIRFSTVQDGSETPSNISMYNLTHKVGKLTTTLNFKPSLILDPLQPFFFHHQEGELSDSCLVLGYRNYNGNFGNRLKTPFKKN